MLQGSNNQSIKSFLKELRINCEARNIPIISSETEIYLGKLLCKYKPNIFLEIGSAVAYSTIYIANIIKERGGIIYSSEISYPAYIEGINNIKQSGLSNIVLYPFDVKRINLEKLIFKGIDFAFIDGQKNQYADYLMKIQNILRSDGVVVCDDVIKYHSKLDSLYGYLKKKQINYKLVKTEPGDGIMILDTRV